MYDNWNDYTQFRDTVHGYIKIHKPIAKEIINTDKFQRLKCIEQTGMRVLYPSATHDRFTHSLGVYHLGLIAYDNFRRNASHAFKDDDKWIRWKILFQLACLLHDCGHAPFSHTLEFVYDLDSSIISTKKIDVNEKNINKQLMQIIDSKSFDEDFCNKSNGINQCLGKPHEKMSGFLICDEYSEKIKSLVKGYMNAFCNPKWSYDSEKQYREDLEFMVRMIIGCHYRLDDKSSKDTESQIRNCIIKLLNSSIDVDNLDYTLRDTKFSGYENTQIDVSRLLNSFTIVKGYECRDAELNFTGEIKINNPVDCHKFVGYACLNIHGKCNMESNDGMIMAKGNLHLRNERNNNEDNAPEVLERKFLFTDIDFSGDIGKYDKTENDLGMVNLTILPSKNKIGEPAYLYLSGQIAGTFSGTIYGNVEKDCLSDKNVKEIYHFAYDKSSISVIQSAVDARNYEYLWIYAHHTITYQICFLLIYMLDCYSNLLHLKEKDDFINKFLGELEKWHETLDKHPSCLTWTENTKALEEDILLVKTVLDSLINSIVSNILCSEDDNELATILLSYQKLSYKKKNLAIEATIKELKDKKQELKEDSLHKMESSIFDLLLDIYSFFLESNDIIKFELDLFRECVEWMSCVYSLKVSGSVDVDEKENWFKVMQLLCETVKEALHNKNDLKITWEVIQPHLEFLSQLKSRMFNKDIQYMVDIVGVPTCKVVNSIDFHYSSDEDLISAYKTEIKNIKKKSHELSSKEKEFMTICDEHFSRKFPHSMWKTYAQYVHLFRNWTKAEKNYVADFFKGVTIAPSYCEDDDERVNYYVLSDNTKKKFEHRKKLNSFYIFLKEKFKIERFIWVNQSIKTKELDVYKTFIKFNDDVLRISDIELFTKSSHAKKFFYFYYICDEDKELSMSNISDIINHLHILIRSEPIMIKKDNNISDMVRIKGEDMNIKDIVFGDIMVTQEFSKIVNTPEFQRLRRIKQLATANLVFPSATHTRFEHSIGVFHVMRKLINHFQEFYEKLCIRINITEDDKKAILMAALLHDIGHGPFSHAFEQALETGFDHEEMTCNIIKNRKTNINRILCDISPEFPDKVVGYIKARNKFKDIDKNHIDKPEFPIYKEDFLWIFCQLVSSQLDADRIDYILRDAAVVGVPYCSFSLENLIKGMQVVFFNEKYYVCVVEKYLSEVESYLYSRYQMYSNVYTSSYKLFSEELLSKIIMRVRILYSGEKIKSHDIPKAVKCMFDAVPIDVTDFCFLDDSVMMGAILDWSLHDDIILSLLCKSFLNRTGFQKVKIMLSSDKDLAQFKSQFTSLINKYSTNTIPDNFISEASFWVEKKQPIAMYNKLKSPIYILCKDGSIKELSEMSPLIESQQKKNNAICLDQDVKSAYYIHFEIMKESLINFLKINGTYDDLEKEVRALIDSFDIRNRLEIEVKYTLLSDDLGLLDQILEFMSSEFEVVDSKQQCISQIDQYYDYCDGQLKSMHKTLRIRERAGKYTVTYKEPTPSSYKIANQTVRIEQETVIAENDICKEWDGIIKSIPNLKAVEPDKLHKILAIKNDRKKIKLKQGDFEIEMVFDDVVYCRDGMECAEKQIELELKSPFEYRINLKLLEDKLQKNFSDHLKLTKESKFDRGISLLKIITN